MRTPSSFITRSLPFLVLITCFSTYGQQSQPKELWKYKTRGSIVAAPAQDVDYVYIGSYDSTFYCLDVNSGKVRWQFRSGGRIGSTAAILEANIYFFSSDGRLYCLDKTTGKLTWQFKTMSGALPDRRYDWPDYYQSSPLVSDNAIYFGGGDGRLYALNAETGKLLWSYQTGDVVHTKPAVQDDKIVVGSFDGNLYCLNRENGTLRWKFKTTGQRYFPRGEINGNPVIHRNKVIVGARDYNLYAVDLDGGYCHWLKSFPYGWALPVTPNDSVLYVGTSDDRILLAVDEETGQVRWRKSLGFNIFAAMAVDGPYGYTATLNGKVYCVALAEGDIRWTYHTDGYKKYRSKYFKEDDNQYVDNIGNLLPDGDAILAMYRELGAVFSQPVIIKEKLVFASNDGMIYCLKR